MILAVRGELNTLKLPFAQIPKIFPTATLLGTNWLVFIYAVVNGNIAETALGYFINPLISVFLGVVFLKEKLRLLQWVAIGLMLAGIAVQLAVFGEIPLVALTLAFSFGFYGLLRKNLGMPPFTGLAIETSMVLPFAVGFLLWSGYNGGRAMGQDLQLDLLLVRH